MVLPGFLYQNTTRLKARFLLLLCKTTLNIRDDSWGLKGRLIRADMRYLFKENFILICKITLI